MESGDFSGGTYTSPKKLGVYICLIPESRENTPDAGRSRRIYLSIKALRRPWCRAWSWTARTAAEILL